ncbi:3,2-trans-enoyl-CoA isomerase [Diutina catenulata]
MSVEDDITYEIKDRTFIITFNIPKKLNAFTGDHYKRLGKLLEEAEAEEDTICTLLTSSGKYFSAGANFGDPAIMNAKPEEVFSHEFWFGQFVARNVWLCDLFHNHTKILAAAVNGPVIGLSAACLALCDLIYVKDEKDFYMLAPFSNLGLVCEGAASSTLFLRLGWSVASEALLLARPIDGATLNKVGFINKTFDGQFSSVEDFNKHIHSMLYNQFKDLHEDSIFKNKQLLKANRDQLINAANSREVIKGFNKWLEGVPQQRFASLAQKEMKHKM